MFLVKKRPVFKAGFRPKWPKWHQTDTTIDTTIDTTGFPKIPLGNLRPRKPGKSWKQWFLTPQKKQWFSTPLRIDIFVKNPYLILIVFLEKSIFDVFVENV